MKDLFESIFYHNQTSTTYFNDHQKMITCIDFNGYLKLEEIFSGPSATGEQVQLTGYSTDSEGKTFFDEGNFKDFDKWDNIWIHKIGLTTTFFNLLYFNAIKNGLDNQGDIMRRILGLDLGGSR